MRGPWSASPRFLYSAARILQASDFMVIYVFLRSVCFIIPATAPEFVSQSAFTDFAQLFSEAEHLQTLSSFSATPSIFINS